MQINADKSDDELAKGELTVAKTIRRIVARTRDARVYERVS